MWSIQPQKIFQVLSSQVIGEGQRCILKDRIQNTFEYIKDHSLEKAIFKKVYSTEDHPQNAVQAVNYMGRNLSQI